MSRILSPEEVWKQYDDAESRLTAQVSERMLELAQLRPAMRVLDLAAGRGEPSLRAARLVAPSGHVVAIDTSGSLLEMAREKAKHDAISNIEFRVGNAEDTQLEGQFFDAVTIRWGLQYMANPVAALMNARRSLRTSGVLVVAVWAEPERVPYYTLPRQILSRDRSIPPIDFNAPGTFAYAQPTRIEEDFSKAGFEIALIEEMNIPVIEAEAPDDFIAWVRALGLTRLLNEIPRSEQISWEQALLVEAQSLRKGDLYQLGGVTRLIAAVPNVTAAI